MVATGRAEVVRAFLFFITFSITWASANEDLSHIREEILSVQRVLIQSLQGTKKAEDRITQIHQLIALQHNEKALAEKRMGELAAFIIELEGRKLDVMRRTGSHRARVRESLRGIHRSLEGTLATFPTPESERIEAPVRHVLYKIGAASLRELEALQVDLTEVEELVRQIQSEKSELANLLQEIGEQESLLEFHEKLQTDILKNDFKQRLSHLERYRKLKDSETQVQSLMSQFNARKELERVEAERGSYAALVTEGPFYRSKGRLSMPAPGRVLAGFGKALDGESGLNVFKKGIEIDAGRAEPVRAVFDGKVVYSGILPAYGKVAILDHGNHYYSLVANLGALEKGVGDTVSAGQILGGTDPEGKPLYFEIRVRSVPVNPMHWVSQ